MHDGRMSVDAIAYQCCIAGPGNYAFAPSGRVLLPCAKVSAAGTNHWKFDVSEGVCSTRYRTAGHPARWPG
eukprot:9132910-Lingulodinium_polyedra.AAC.1